MARWTRIVVVLIGLIPALVFAPSTLWAGSLPSCVGFAACEGTSSPLGPGACVGEFACLNNSGAVGKAGCQGDFACGNNSGSVGVAACIGEVSCAENYGEIGKQGCQGFRACGDNGGSPVGVGACRGSGACGGNENEVKKLGCVGESACGENSGVVGEGACVGRDACFANYADVAKLSCQGDGACFQNGGSVGEGGCRGNEACEENRGQIGKNACRGERACAFSGPGAIGTGACIGDRACFNNPGPIASRTCVGLPDPVTGKGICEGAPRPAECGGTVPCFCGGSVPCSCGATVSESRVLEDGVDPVTTTVCRGHGLIVGSGVDLDLGGSTIRGRGGPGTVGILLEAGAFRVMIRNGRVARFESGILARFADEVHVAYVQAIDNRLDGIALSGSVSVGASVRNSDARRNGGIGIAVGTGFIFDSSAVLNGSHGVVADGLDETAGISGVVSMWNGGAGVSFQADGGRVSGVLSEGNRGDGYIVLGEDVSVGHSEAVGNLGHGFRVPVGCFGAGECDVSGVQTSHNGGFGIVGELGEFSGFFDNHCEGDRLGDSDPPGLCD